MTRWVTLALWFSKPLIYWAIFAAANSWWADRHPKNHLSLMELVSRFGRSPAKIDPLAETRQGSPTGTVERPPFPHERLEPLRDQRAHGPTLFSGNHTCLAKKIRVELQSDVGPSGHDSSTFVMQHNITCSILGVSM